jgi:hypothetical protein
LCRAGDDDRIAVVEDSANVLSAHLHGNRTALLQPQDEPQSNGVTLLVDPNLVGDPSQLSRS